MDRFESRSHLYQDHKTHFRRQRREEMVVATNYLKKEKNSVSKVIKITISMFLVCAYIKVVQLDTHFKM